MRNAEIRKAIHDAGLRYWQVADALNIADTTFTKWLRKELDSEKKSVVMDAINKLINER